MLRKFINLLIGDVEDRIYAYIQDFREAIYLASNFSKNTDNTDNIKINIPKLLNFNRVSNKAQDYLFQKSILLKTVKEWNYRLRFLQNCEINEDFIWRFNKERGNTFKTLEYLSKELRNLITTVSECLDSLPYWESNVIRFTRKIDAKEQETLERVGDSYILELLDNSKLFGTDLYNELQNFLEQSRKRLIIYVDHSSSTRFYNSYAIKLNALREIQNIQNKNKPEELNWLDSIKLPYWILRSPKFLNFVSHEICHSTFNFINSYVPKIKPNLTEESDFYYRIKQIKRKVEKIISYHPILAESLLLPTLSDKYLEEVLADFFSLICSGPSYYFSLFSQLITDEPFANFINFHLPNPYVRLNVLYLILTDKDFIMKDKIDFTEENNYWLTFLNTSHKYLDTLKNASMGKINSSISAKKMRNIIAFYDLLSKTLYEAIKEEFKEIAPPLFHWKYSEKFSPNGLTLNEILTNIFSENTLELINIPSKLFWHECSFNCENQPGENATEDKYFKKFNTILLPEILWCISLNTIYNKDFSEAEPIFSETGKNFKEEKKAEVLRIPYSRFARILSLSDRNFLIKKDLQNNIRLGEPNEWLCLEMNWNKLKENKKYIIGNNSNNEKNIDIVSVLSNYLKGEEIIDSNTDKKFNLEVLSCFGEFEYLVKLNASSSRRNIEWPPRWLLEVEVGSIKKATGLYRFRRVINEKLIINDSEKSNDNTIDIPEKLIIFLEFDKSNNSNIHNFIKQLSKQKENFNFSIYLSSSWNDITIELELNSFDTIIKFLNLELFKENKIRETQSFISIDTNSSINTGLELPFGAITTIKARGMMINNTLISENLKSADNYIEMKNQTLGSSDYVINWKPNSCLVEIRNVISRIIMSDLYDEKEESCIIDISTLIPFSNKENLILNNSHLL